MSNLIKRGTKGDNVKTLQQNLQKLGFDLEADGIFGENTEKTVKEFQSLFGYTVDGIVGDGTNGLITAQIGYGWNYKAPNARELALKAQGKA